MSKNLPTITSQKFDSNEIALLRNTYAKGLDDTQLRVFLKMAESMDLNPFKKEIYANVISGRLVLMTSIDGRRKIAHKTGKYLGCKVSIQRKESNGQILSATAVAKKLVGSHVAEFEATVLFSEFNTDRDNWKTKPQVMISKVAEATALRMAFPALSDSYDEAETEAGFANDDIPVDAMPAYEAESQAPETLEYTDVPNPGEFLVTIGSRKDNPVKLKEIPRDELMDYVKWCYTQKKLADPLKEYLVNAELFLEQNQN